jgi:hypothetical protein
VNGNGRWENYQCRDDMEGKAKAEKRPARDDGSYESMRVLVDSIIHR